MLKKNCNLDSGGIPDFQIRNPDLPGEVGFQIFGIRKSGFSPSLKDIHKAEHVY